MFANTHVSYSQRQLSATICALLLWAGLVNPSAQASTFVAMDQEALTLGSDAVVHGRFIQVESYWDETDSVIFTDAILEIKNQIIGQHTTLVDRRPYLRLKNASYSFYAHAPRL